MKRFGLPLHLVGEWGIEMDLLNEEITGIKAWILGKYSMNKMPEDGQLKSLLDGYTKEKLMDLSVENGFEAERRWKKAKLVDYVADCILESLEERLMILGKENLQLIQKKVEGSAGGSDEVLGFYLRAFPAATRMGLLFSFENEDGMVSYISDEVKEKIGEVVRDFTRLEQKYANQLRFWKTIEDLIHAAIALYGVVSKGTIYDLWEIYDTKIKKVDVEEQLSIMGPLFYYIPLIAMRNNFYVVKGYLLGSDLLDNEEKVDIFYGHLPDRSQLAIYKPTKGDLNEYIKHAFDRRSTYYKKLKRLISKQQLHIPFHNMMRYIETNIQLGKTLTVLTNDIKKMGMMLFRTPKDLEKFALYYMDLVNHSRMWQLRGHTPVEARKMMAE